MNYKEADSMVDLWLVSWVEEGQYHHSMGFKYRESADKILRELKAENYPYKQPVKITHMRIGQISTSIYSRETIQLLRNEGLIPKQYYNRKKTT